MINNTPGSQHKLAIVIPAYKAEFLKQALISISSQTDRRFKVYVGDDASPENLKIICEQFYDSLDIFYERFDNNMGATSLVSQWNRCVKLSHEPWVWLFCDDDLMEPECVRYFYQAISYKKNKYQLYRFNTVVIDADNQIIQSNPLHPEVESGVDFAYQRFCRTRMSFVSEYIFSRKTFENEGGFVEFPLAWCSDDASWIIFAGSKGIYTINGANVHWRQSGLNISTADSQYQDSKIDATLQYLSWITKRLENKHCINTKRLRKAAREWFFCQLVLVAPVKIFNYYKVLKLNQSNRIIKRFSINNFIMLIRINLNFYIAKLLHSLSK